MPRRTDLNKLRAALSQLHLEQARQVYAELGAIIQALEQQAMTPTVSGASGREVVETQHLGDRLYQLEHLRCGKVGCKCAGSSPCRCFLSSGHECLKGNRDSGAALNDTAGSRCSNALRIERSTCTSLCWSLPGF